MPRKKRSGKKPLRRTRTKSKSSFTDNLIFFSSLVCLLLFAGWLAWLYLPLGKILPKAPNAEKPAKVAQLAKPQKSDAETNWMRKGQQLLLRTRDELSRNQSLFQAPLIFSDCPVDEHYVNCLELTLGSDTDFILAEKWLKDFWEREKVQVTSRRGNTSKDSLILSAVSNETRLAQIILKGSETPAPSLPKTPQSRKRISEKGKVAIVIDDLGDNEEEALEIARSPGPIALSILPFQTRSKEILELAKKYHKPAMLHLPMEPLESTGANPGPNALLCSMSPEQIIATLSKALDSLPGVIGVNNHMGSAFTARRDLMEPTLLEINQRGLFFLDSKTSSHSVGYQLAQEMGIKSCERKIFLDNLQDPEMISQKFRELCKIAREEGSAIGIGHPYPETIRALSEELDQLQISGCELVPIQELCQ